MEILDNVNKIIFQKLIYTILSYFNMQFRDFVYETLQNPVVISLKLMFSFKTKLLFGFE